MCLPKPGPTRNEETSPVRAVPIPASPLLNGSPLSGHPSSLLVFRPVPRSLMFCASAASPGSAPRACSRPASSRVSSPPASASAHPRFQLRRITSLLCRRFPPLDLIFIPMPPGSLLTPHPHASRAPCNHQSPFSLPVIFPVCRGRNACRSPGIPPAASRCPHASLCSPPPPPPVPINCPRPHLASACLSPSMPHLAYFRSLAVLPVPSPCPCS